MLDTAAAKRVFKTNTLPNAEIKLKLSSTKIEMVYWGGGTYLKAFLVPGLQETNTYFMVDIQSGNMI